MLKQKHERIIRIYSQKYEGIIHICQQKHEGILIEIHSGKETAGQNEPPAVEAPGARFIYTN